MSKCIKMRKNREKCIFLEENHREIRMRFINFGENVKKCIQKCKIQNAVIQKIETSLEW